MLNILLFTINSIMPLILINNIADIDNLSEIRLDVIVYVLAIVFVLLVIGFLSSFLIKEPRQKGVINQCIFRSNFALIGVLLTELMCESSGVVMAAELLCDCLVLIYVYLNIIIRNITETA